MPPPCPPKPERVLTPLVRSYAEPPGVMLEVKFEPMPGELKEVNADIAPPGCVAEIGVFAICCKPGKPALYWFRTSVGFLPARLAHSFPSPLASGPRINASCAPNLS